MAAPLLVDSHCHLNYGTLVDDLPGVLSRAEGAGVGTMLTISTTLETFPEVLAIAEAHDNICCSVGGHPHHAEEEPDISAADLIALADHPKVVGIGETGLDYYYDTAPREAQKKNFIAHVEAARETGLPIIVHSRDAEEDTLEILKAGLEQGPYSGVIHCFTASQGFADAALELGFYISLSGIVTFKNAKDIQETTKTIPEDRLLVETDSPYLAPVPHRGKPCQPAYVADTARFVADLRGMSLEDLTAATTENFFRLFSKAATQREESAG